MEIFLLMVSQHVVFLHRSVGGEVTQDGDFLLFEGNRYDRRGFLYKNFVMSAIVSKSFIYLCHLQDAATVHSYFINI